MNKNLSKRFDFACGLIFFFIGCVFLILFIVIIQCIVGKILLNILEMAGLLCILILAVISFYTSIESFIKYGIALGIDYAIEQEKPMTMEDVDKRIDEILKTSDKE